MSKSPHIDARNQIINLYKYKIEEETFTPQMFRTLIPSPFYKSVLIEYDYDDIMSQCLSSSATYFSICKDSYFWISKAYNDFNDIEITSLSNLYRACALVLTSNNLDFIINESTTIQNFNMDYLFIFLAFSNFDIIKYMCHRFPNFITPQAVERIINYISFRHDAEKVLEYLYQKFPDYVMEYNNIIHPALWNSVDLFYVLSFFNAHGKKLQLENPETCFVKSFQTLDKEIIDFFYKYLDSDKVDINRIKRTLELRNYGPMTEYVKSLFINHW